MKVTLLSLLVALFAAPALPQQSPPLSGPTLGFTKWGTSLRLLLGVPGAARFGPHVPTGDFEPAAICGESDSAILLSADRTQARIVDLREGGTIEALPSEGSAIDAVKCSPRGSAIALVRGNRAEVLTGLPRAVVRKAVLEFPEALSGAAISDDGEIVVGNCGGILIRRDTSAEKAVGPVQGDQDPAFRPGSHDFVYASAETLTYMSTAGAAGLPLRDNGKLASFSFSADGNWLIVAGSRLLSILPTAGGPSQELESPCAAAVLRPVGAAILQLQCSSEDRVYLVVLGAVDSRVLFVPQPVE